MEDMLSRYFDGSITAEELAELEARLVSDAEFAIHVSRSCLMHRQIAELLTETKLHELMDDYIKGAPILPKSALRRLLSPATRAESAPWMGASTEIRRLAAHSLRSRRFIAGSIIAVSLAVFLTSLALWQRTPSNASSSGATTADGSVNSNRVSDPSHEVVATLTQVSDCVWEENAPVLHHGQQLMKGDLIALKSGMVKVTFDCGAEVVLQGPCEFWLRSAMIGYLTSGRITANVPRRAFSFAILSPQVDFVDLGTSFGVDVGADGRTELHVFAGEVLCSQPKDDPAERSAVIHVTANNAMEFGDRGKDPSDIAMSKEPFSSLIALRRATEVNAGRLVGDHLALWLAADVAVTTNTARRVVAWQDIVYGDNLSAEDAVQPDELARPSWVPDAINGHPGVRFDGKSNYLLTTPLETTDDQTVIFVCQYSPAAQDKNRKWGGQIINYDGPPSRFLSNTLEPGVLQIGEPLLEKEFQPTLLTGQVFAGFIGSATVESGRADAIAVGPERPVIVSYTYDYEYENGRSALAINGRTYGEGKAFAPQGITSRKIIGRHAWMQNYFHGDLAELLIYNKPLSEKELADTTAYLAAKYSIALDPKVERSPEVSK